MWFRKPAPFRTEPQDERKPLCVNWIECMGRDIKREVMKIVPGALAVDPFTTVTNRLGDIHRTKVFIQDVDGRTRVFQITVRETT